MRRLTLLGVFSGVLLGIAFFLPPVFATMFSFAVLLFSVMFVYLTLDLRDELRELAEQVEQERRRANSVSENYVLLDTKVKQIYKDIAELDRGLDDLSARI